MINIKQVNIYSLTPGELKSIAHASIEEYRPLVDRALSSKIREVQTLDTISKALQKYTVVDPESRELQKTISTMIDKEYPERATKPVLTPHDMYKNMQSNCTEAQLHSNSRLYSNR